MSRGPTMDEANLSALRALVGDSYVLTEASDLEAYGRDWTRLFPPKATAIVLPATREQVAEVVKFCSARKLAIVPSGGRTGLAGGAVATQGEVVLSLARMNRIEKIDTVGLSIVAQAGVTTQEVQEAAAEAGLFFPLDLAAKGSCHIGGNIATNAGGVKFIRYGGMREQVLGLEVVLPSGDIVDMNSALRKNNTGYDLKQLFIGSEGTLGIITRATLRLVPKPRNLQVAIMAVADFARIPQILHTCNQLGVSLTAFEFFTKLAHEIVLQHAPGARSPFDERAPYYVLLEAEDGPGDNRLMEALLEKLFEQDFILDAALASTSEEFKAFWGLRENITESIAAHGHARKNDIALAIDQLEPFIAELGREIALAPADMKLVLFGHIGDGNLHINYVAAKGEPFEHFQARARSIEERIFALLARYKGSVSAEHGIGLLKKKDLHCSRSALEIAMMRQIKQAIDPQNLMNPGKIFDL